MAGMYSERLIVRNFGPITDLDIEIRPLTLFIGTQGSGKSTVAKLLAICRNAEWWQQVQTDAEADELMKPFYGFAIDEYFQDDSYFSYTFDGPVHSICYRLTSIASTLLTPYLTTLVSNNNGIVVGVKAITRSGSCYNKKFSLCSGNKYVYLTTYDNNPTEVLTTFSFFFCNPIEYDMLLSQTKDNKCRVEVHTPEYKKAASKEAAFL